MNLKITTNSTTHAILFIQKLEQYITAQPEECWSLVCDVVDCAILFANKENHASLGDLASTKHFANYLPNIALFAKEIAGAAPVGAFSREIHQKYTISMVDRIIEKYTKFRDTHPFGNTYTEIYLQSRNKYVPGDNPPIGVMFVPKAPYDEYSKGRILYNPEGRRTVMLTGAKKRSSTTVMYLRYHYATDLWYRKKETIADGYEVDHIDNDKTNDTLSNAQLLSKTDNLKKERERIGIKTAEIVCPICRSIFRTEYCEAPNARRNEKRKYPIRLCSDRCRNIYNLTIRSGDEYGDLRKWLSENQVSRILRVWSDGKEMVEHDLSNAMYEFDFEATYGHLLNRESIHLASEKDKLHKYVELHTAGLSPDEIAATMGVNKRCLRKWYRKLSRVNFSVDQFLANRCRAEQSRSLYETICNELEGGLNRYRISKKLKMSPSTVHRILRRYGYTGS